VNVEWSIQCLSSRSDLAHIPCTSRQCFLKVAYRDFTLPTPTQSTGWHEMRRNCPLTGTRLCGLPVTVGTNNLP